LRLHAANFKLDTPVHFQPRIPSRNKLSHLLFVIFYQGCTMAEERETSHLIGSDKVEGTDVYGPDRQRIGSIKRVMIEKMSGKVSYAVLSFGGFLGLGHEHYPLPWPSLKYNEELGGYQVNVTEAQLKGAPKYANESDWDWSDKARGRQVYDWYEKPFGM